MAGEIWLEQIKKKPVQRAKKNNQGPTWEGTSSNLTTRKFPEYTFGEGKKKTIPSKGEKEKGRQRGSERVAATQENIEEHGRESPRRKKQNFGKTRIHRAYARRFSNEETHLKSLP